MAKRDGYRVGRGRPPRASQFKPGRSGNPSGRPKGSSGVNAVIAKALAEKVVVTENGQRREISKLEAAAKQLANQAAGGNHQSAKLLLGMLAQAEDRSAGEAPAIDKDAQQARDTEVIQALARYLGKDGDQDQ